jgi:hypothetical protein
MRLNLEGSGGVEGRSVGEVLLKSASCFDNARVTPVGELISLPPPPSAPCEGSVQWLHIPALSREQLQMRPLLKI